MAINLPYMVSSWTLTKILHKICEAWTPENFNGDFLWTKLWFPWGNQKAFIPWAKKCKLLSEDWTPTQLYKNFRNPTFRWVSMAEALKKWYEELYVRNEYAHELSKSDFTKLVTDATALEHDNTIVKSIVNSFFNAKEFADFDGIKETGNSTNVPEISSNNDEESKMSLPKKQIDLWINYTINLVLPKTDDPAIYNAIFKSLKDNLLNE